MEKWGVWVAKEQNWGCEVGGPVFDMCLVHALVVIWRALLPVSAWLTGSYSAVSETVGDVSLTVKPLSTVCLFTMASKSAIYFCR